MNVLGLATASSLPAPHHIPYRPLPAVPLAPGLLTEMGEHVSDPLDVVRELPHAAHLLEHLHRRVLQQAGEQVQPAAVRHPHHHLAQTSYRGAPNQGVKFRAGCCLVDGGGG